MTYRFQNIDELAAYLENKGAEIAHRESRNKKEEHFRNGEAYAHKAIADLLRNTMIGMDD